MQKNKPNPQKPVILISPLDWGLGHTTRVIPVIKEFLQQDCSLVVACNSIQKAVLQLEFPGLNYVNLNGYNVKYGSTMTGNRLLLLLQTFKILIKIKKEHLWFLQYSAKNRVDAVISDNRYGLYSPSIPSVLITHQLQPISGFGKVIDAVAGFFLHKKIIRFTECWVPDAIERNGLAGVLSHQQKLSGIPVIYMGPLSRMKPFPAIEERNLLILLSGPEPQRTILENKIIKQLQFNTRNVILVRGLPAELKQLPPVPNTVLFNHADSKILNKLICSAALVICRSGYTTVMDMVKLKKKMVVIPTPGQAEQEYLGKYLSTNNIAPAADQLDFSLEKAIEKSAAFTYIFPDYDMNEYRTVIRRFIASRFS